MFKHYFEQVHNVEIWPIISLSIFFVFFIGLTIYVIRISRGYVRHMEQMPLNDDQNQSFNSNLGNHGK